MAVWLTLTLTAVAGLALRAHSFQPSRDAAGLAHLPTPAPPRPSAPGQPSPDDVVTLKNLLTERDTLVRPDIEATVVNVSLGIRHITLNEMQSTMSVSAWVKMEWLDSRMQMMWQNSSAPAFRAIKMLHISSESIWHPDIMLKNSLSGRGSSVMDGSGAVLHQDGRVVWAPAVLLEAYCALDLRRWPFERHECELHLGSGTLDMSQLQIGAMGHKHEFPGQTAGEFVVDWISETREETLEAGFDKPFDGVLFSFGLHREPGTYHAVIFTPAAVVIILCLATFLLPPRSGEKVILGGVNAMLICLFLIYFAHSLPVLTNQTPLIVVFYSASLYMVCLSLVVAVLVLNLSRQPHSRGLPWALKQTLTGSLGRFLLLSGYIEQIMGVDHGPCGARSRSSGVQEELPVVFHDEMAAGGGDRSSVASLASLGAGDARDDRCSAAEIGSKRADPNQDWLLLAAAVDRVLFLVYAVLFVILAVAFQV